MKKTAELRDLDHLRAQFDEDSPEYRDLTAQRRALTKKKKPAKRRTKYARDETAIDLLAKATIALADYRDHVAVAASRDCYQRHATSEPMRALKELLKEERRGWTDL